MCLTCLISVEFVSSHRIAATFHHYAHTYGKGMLRSVRPSVCLSHAQNRGYAYYRTLIGNPMLGVERTGLRAICQSVKRQRSYFTSIG